MKRNGLTMVEVLVLLVATMVALAGCISVISSALSDAQKSGCQANLKVIGGSFREYARVPGGFPRNDTVGDPTVGPATAANMAALDTNAMNTVAWPMLNKSLLPVTAFHCPADSDWTERDSADPVGWSANTEFSYGVQFPYDEDHNAVAAGDACPAEMNYPPNGILMADIGNDDSGSAIVSDEDHYTNHSDGLAYLTLAGNVSYHSPDVVDAANGSVVLGNQIYDDDTIGGADVVPDSTDLATGSILDVVILPLR